MLKLTAIRLPVRGTGRYLLAAALALELVVFLLIIARVRASRQAYSATVAQRASPLWTKNAAGPTNRPPILLPREANMPPNEPVIGVDIGGKARAYRVTAFDDASGHVVNDMLGDTPVSISYNNMTGSARVYTGPKGAAPLEFESPGLFGGHMVLKIEGAFYFHDSGGPLDARANRPPLVCKILAPNPTQWKAWLARYPDTDVYVGGR
jgi:hypothetical protein